MFWLDTGSLAFVKYSPQFLSSNIRQRDIPQRDSQ